MVFANAPLRDRMLGKAGSDSKQAVNMDISTCHLRKVGIDLVKIEPLENLPNCTEGNPEIESALKDEDPVWAHYYSSNPSATTSDNLSTNGVTASQPVAVTGRQGSGVTDEPIEAGQGISGQSDSAQRQERGTKHKMPQQIVLIFPNITNPAQTLMLPVGILPKTEPLNSEDLPLCTEENTCVNIAMKDPSSPNTSDTSDTTSDNIATNPVTASPPVAITGKRRRRPGVTVEPTGSRPNSIRSLFQNPFERRTLEEKLEVKELGPDQPDLNIRQHASEKGKTYTRGFSCNWYNRKAWLAGCSHVNAVFCFPCLLCKTSGTDTTWTVTGVTDMKHLSEKIKKHESSKAHMENTFKLAMLGRVNIATQLDKGHRIGVKKHNEEVEKNRQIVAKIIDSVKFCRAFELALRGHNDTESSDNPGGFRGVVDLVASLDSVLEEHLTSSVFKGTSNTVRHELLNCMLTVCKDYILEEVKNADCLAIQADETADISTHCQLMLVLRYIDTHNNVQERFFEFIPLLNATADTVATALLERLSTILPEGQENRLIAQAYDGAAVMRGATGGVKRKVKDVYGSAHYVHCYAHQLSLTVQQATSHIPTIGTFFSDLGGFSAFFCQSSKRTAVLNQVVANRLPGTRWNFQSRAVITVYEHKDDLRQCFQAIRDSGDFDPPTVREAGGFVRMLEDEDFCFFLALFHKIMPHVEILFNQLQKKNIDSVYIAEVLQRFTVSMQTIRNSIPSLHGECSGSVQQQQQPPPAKKRWTLELEHTRLATVVCDTILSHSMERFSFTKHLIGATLLQGDLFPEHTIKFPDSALETAVEAYPVLNKAKLKTELSLIYENEQFKACCGALPLFQFFMENNLQGTFTETVSLLKILITTPMTTAESERCFPTLQRIKTFLRNTVTQDCLNALAMLSMERELIKNIPDFNNRVIERFASQKTRREEFMYK